MAADERKQESKLKQIMESDDKYPDKTNILEKESLISQNYENSAKHIAIHDYNATPNASSILPWESKKNSKDLMAGETIDKVLDSPNPKSTNRRVKESLRVS